MYVFDCGYPSAGMFLDLLDMGQCFLFRLGSSHFKKEQKNMERDDCIMERDDCIVEIVFDKNRIRATCKENPDAARKMADAESVKLRFVRVTLPSGDQRVLITNLPYDTFDSEEIAHLYTMRWGVETVYDDLKNKLEIENFTGTKENIIFQDIYATILLSNIINDIISETTVRIKQNLKHPMQLNRSFAIGVLKVGLLDVFLEKSHKKRHSMMVALEKEILTQLLPIRPGRMYYRPSNLASKFSNVRKRSY